jgi:hypothetical protein
MGARNVKRAYAAWGSLPDGPFRMLAYMALVSRDEDAQPRFYAGREALAYALGRSLTDAESEEAEGLAAQRRAYKAVDRMLASLKAAGAIYVIRSASRTHHAEYGLRLGAQESTPVTVVLSDAMHPDDRGPFGRESTPVSGSKAPRLVGGKHPGHRGPQEEVGRTGGGGNAQQPAARPNRPGEPPLPPKPTLDIPTRCARHRDGDSDAPCRACRDAREAAEQAQEAHQDDVDAWERQLLAWERWKRDQPMCRHDVPGGDLIHPASDAAVCPGCRRAASNTNSEPTHQGAAA